MKSKLLLPILVIILLIPLVNAIEYTVPRSVHSIECSDINGDNEIDILVGSSFNSTESDTITIFLNTGSDEFERHSFARNNAHVLLSKDIDNDNLPDLVTKLRNSYDISFYKNYDYNLFGEESYLIHSSLDIHREEINIEDLNNDENQDLIFINRSNYSELGAYLGYSLNNADGTFTDTIIYNDNNTISSCVTGYVNEDDYPDILISGTFGTKLYINNFPNFEEVIIDTTYMCKVYMEDMNNNGNNDLILFYQSSFSESWMRVYYNNGNNIFDEMESFNFPQGTSLKDIADFNNDGLMDIIALNSAEETVESILVYFAQPDGTFSDADLYTIGIPQWFKVKTADFNNDGFQDIVVSAYWYPGTNCHGLNILYNDRNGSFVEEPPVYSDNVFVNSPEYLIHNYPNPFNPTTTISFSLPEDGSVKLDVYNVKGQKLKTLTDEDFSTGKHTVIWNGNHDSGNKATSGIYFYKLSVNGKSKDIKKMILLK